MKPQLAMQNWGIANRLQEVEARKMSEFIQMVARKSHHPILEIDDRTPSMNDPME